MGAAASVGDVRAALAEERTKTIDASEYETHVAAVAEVVRLRTMLFDLFEVSARGVAPREGAASDDAPEGSPRERPSSKIPDLSERGCDLVSATRRALASEVEKPRRGEDLEDLASAKAEIVRLRERMKELWVADQLRVQETSPRRRSARESQW